MVNPGPGAHWERWLELVIVLGFFDAIWSAISAALGFIGDVAVSVGTAIAAVWKIISPIFGDVWKAVRPIWDHVLRPFWTKVTAWVTQLKKWWARWAKPVTDLFKTIHKIERAIYDATFGPILDTISNLQKLISLLGLSNTAIGKAIGGALHDVTTRLEQTYFVLTQPINDLIRRVDDYILGIDGFLNSELLLTSIFRNIGRIWLMWWDQGIGELTPEGRLLLKKYGTRFPVARIIENAKKELASPALERDARVVAAVQTFTAILEGRDPDGWTTGPPPVE